MTLLALATEMNDRETTKLVIYNRSKVLNYLLDKFQYTKEELATVFFRTEGPLATIAAAMGLHGTSQRVTRPMRLKGEAYEESDESEGE